MIHAPASDRHPRPRGGGVGPTPSAIPTRLLNLPWVGWQLQPDPQRAKPRKRPINPRTGRAANPADPRTGADFAAAAAAVRRYGLDGVGVILSLRYGLTGVDLDNCRDPATGELADWAGRIMDRLPGTYAEWSPSGRGVHVFVDGLLPPGCRHKVGDVEAYDDLRFLAFTGARLRGRPLAITDADDGLGLLVAEYLTPRPVRPPAAVSNGYSGDDAALVRRAITQPGTGPRLAALLAGKAIDHPSRSEADYELCRILGYWCGGDPVRVERIARASDAYRLKWDERRNDTTWIAQTIREALRRLSRVYAPVRPHTPKTQNREDKSVSHTDGTTREKTDRLLAYVRGLRLRHGRPVGLSVRQAKDVIGGSPANAARRLADFVRDSRLILVTKGNYGTGLASVYDLPEFAPTPPAVPTAGGRADRRAGARPAGRPPAPPHTQTPGGLLSVWRWSPRERRWQHYGDCPGRDAADALAGRHMARRPGWWAVGEVLRRYARGRGMRDTWLHQTASQEASVPVTGGRPADGSSARRRRGEPPRVSSTP